MPQHQFEYLAQHAYPRRTALRYYRLANVVWLWIAVAIVLGFVAWRVEPSNPAGAFDLKVHDPLVLWVFHLGGLAAALALGVGVWVYSPRLEILGHCLLTAFIVANAVAVLELRTTGTIVTALSFTVTISIAFASACRVVYLVKFTPGLRHR
jgi:hypothetical protein